MRVEGAGDVWPAASADRSLGGCAAWVIATPGRLATDALAKIQRIDVDCQFDLVGQGELRFGGAPPCEDLFDCRR